MSDFGDAPLGGVSVLLRNAANCTRRPASSVRAAQEESRRSSASRTTSHYAALFPRCD
jgi:hypothetical protein